MPISPGCAAISVDAERVKNACVGRGAAAPFNSVPQDGALLKDGSRRSLSDSGVLDA
jgi:hypothetical protein